VILIVTGRFFLQKFQPYSTVLSPQVPPFPSSFHSCLFTINLSYKLKKLSILLQCCKQAEYINEYEQHNAQTQIQHIIEKLSTFHQILTKGIHNVHVVCYAHYDANWYIVGFFSSNFYSFYTTTQPPARLNLHPFIFD